MPSLVPAEIHGQKYVSLATFRKNGDPVRTPVWFGEEGEKLYVMSRSDAGKSKRIRNNSAVTVAACTIRGKVTGPEFSATAKILSPDRWPDARNSINRKYWLARVPFLWSKQNIYFEIEVRQRLS